MSISKNNLNFHSEVPQNLIQSKTKNETRLQELKKCWSVKNRLKTVYFETIFFNNFYLCIFVWKSNSRWNVWISVGICWWESYNATKLQSGELQSYLDGNKEPRHTMKLFTVQILTMNSEPHSVSGLEIKVRATLRGFWRSIWCVRKRQITKNNWNKHDRWFILLPIDLLAKCTHPNYINFVFITFQFFIQFFTFLFNSLILFYFYQLFYRNNSISFWLCCDTVRTILAKLNV